jgi:Zn-dependent metalloprotease
VVREYRTKHNGVTHVWVQQQHHGIPVFNGLFGLHVKANGEVVHLGHRFVNDLGSRASIRKLPSLERCQSSRNGHGQI